MTRPSEKPTPNWTWTESQNTTWIANQRNPVASQPIQHNSFYDGGGHRAGVHDSEVPQTNQTDSSPSSESSSYYNFDPSEIEKPRARTRTPRPRQTPTTSNLDTTRTNTTRLQETITIDSDTEDDPLSLDAPRGEPTTFRDHTENEPPHTTRQAVQVITLDSDSESEALPVLPSEQPSSVFRMTALDIVQDPQLRSVLEAADRACRQCIAILDLIQSNRDLKSSPTFESDLSTQQKVLYSHLAVVRGLNRKALLNARKTKQETTDARQEVDRLHLQLQNLYYEQRHLRGEITVCENYDHSYKSLPLIPIDEFLTLHPQHAGATEHDQMLARIEHEHSDRVALEETRQGLLKKKQTYIAENNKRKEILAALDRSVEKWMENAQVVQKEFERAEVEMKKREEGWNATGS